MACDANSSLRGYTLGNVTYNVAYNCMHGASPWRHAFAMSVRHYEAASEPGEALPRSAECPGIDCLAWALPGHCLGTA
eukprot:7357531-Prymnesium_polylepis.1